MALWDDVADSITYCNHYMAASNAHLVDVAATFAAFTKYEVRFVRGAGAAEKGGGGQGGTCRLVFAHTSSGSGGRCSHSMAASMADFVDVAAAFTAFTKNEVRMGMEGVHVCPGGVGGGGCPTCTACCRTSWQPLQTLQDGSHKLQLLLSLKSAATWPPCLAVHWQQGTGECLFPRDPWEALLPKSTQLFSSKALRDGFARGVNWSKGIIRDMWCWLACLSLKPHCYYC
jgi:hypothetical protein